MQRLSQRILSTNSQSLLASVRELALQVWLPHFPDARVLFVDGAELEHPEWGEPVTLWRTYPPEPGRGWRVSCAPDSYSPCAWGEGLMSYLALRGDELIVEDFHDSGANAKPAFWQSVYDWSPNWRREFLIKRARRYGIVLPLPQKKPEPESYDRPREMHIARPMLDWLADLYGCCIRTEEVDAFWRIRSVTCSFRQGEREEQLPALDPTIGRNVFHEWSVGEWLKVFERLSTNRMFRTDADLAHWIQQAAWRMNRERWD